MLAPPGMDLCELPRISFNTTLTTSISSRYFNIFQTFNKMMHFKPYAIIPYVLQVCNIFFSSMVNDNGYHLSLLFNR